MRNVHYIRPLSRLSRYGETYLCATGTSPRSFSANLTASLILLSLDTTSLFCDDIGFGTKSVSAGAKGEKCEVSFANRSSRVPTGRETLTDDSRLVQ